MAGLEWEFLEPYTLRHSYSHGNVLFIPIPTHSSVPYIPCTHCLCLCPSLSVCVCHCMRVGHVLSVSVDIFVVTSASIIIAGGTTGKCYFSLFSLTHLQVFFRIVVTWLSEYVVQSRYVLLRLLT